MTVLVALTFELGDLQNIPTLPKRHSKLSILVLTLLWLAMALITGGTILILWRHGMAGFPLVIVAVMAWIMTISTFKAANRRKPDQFDKLQRLATAMSPMQMEFADDRVIITMPLGNSAQRYDSLYGWYITPRNYYLRLKRYGAFVVPARYVTPEDAAAVASRLRERGIWVCDLSKTPNAS